MNTLELTNYEKIAKAIAYIKLNFKQQPDLDELAEQINISPFHFQRMFKEWAGVSPKKFLQFISLNYAKTLLKGQQATLFDTAFETGLSGTGRLHDLFITLEGMTPGEYKNGGESLQISYSFSDTLFGEVIVASTVKGVCYLAFVSSREEAVTELIAQFPNAAFTPQTNMIQKNALAIFKADWSDTSQVKLHLKGTSFQLKVWEALIKIPSGKLATYGSISHSIDNHKASRAVGSAIGSNPVAYLIPCHRVIRSTGEFGGYHWGNVRKTAIIGWEAANFNPDASESTF